MYLTVYGDKLAHSVTANVNGYIIVVAFVNGCGNVKHSRIPFAFLCNVLNYDIVLFNIICCRKEIYLRFAVIAKNLFRQGHRALHICRTVGALRLSLNKGIELTMYLVYLYARCSLHHELRLGICQDDRNYTAVLKSHINKLLCFVNCSLKASFVSVACHHACGSIDDDHLFVLISCVLGRDYRLSKEKRTNGEYQTLTQKQQYVIQFVNGKSLFSVLQAQFPDERTGNHFMLIIRLNDVDNYKSYQT